MMMMDLLLFLLDYRWTWLATSSSSGMSQNSHELGEKGPKVGQ